MYDLFSDLFDGFDWFMQPTTYKEEKKCPVCGRTYSDFRRDGKLGCSECYKVFRGPVTETLRQIHPSTVHVGKIPSKSGEELKLKRKYETLKQELYYSEKEYNEMVDDVINNLKNKYLYKIFNLIQVYLFLI